MQGVWGMKDNLNNIILKKSEEPVKLVDVECQNCGRLVKVPLNYVGCVFCDDCMQPEIYQADASEFKPKYNWVGR